MGNGIARRSDKRLQEQLKVNLALPRKEVLHETGQTVVELILVLLDNRDLIDLGKGTVLFGSARLITAAHPSVIAVSLGQIVHHLIRLPPQLHAVERRN